MVERSVTIKGAYEVLLTSASLADLMSQAGKFQVPPAYTEKWNVDIKSFQVAIACVRCACVCVCVCESRASVSIRM
jgi:hypothetical protein